MRADLSIACTAAAIDPTPDQWRAVLDAYEDDLARYGQCEHRAAYAMGPRWTRCLDCHETWETRPPRPGAN